MRCHVTALTGYPGEIEKRPPRRPSGNRRRPSGISIGAEAAKG